MKDRQEAMDAPVAAAKGVTAALARLRIDWPRFVFFATASAALALAGNYLGNRSIPLISLELLLLAPFLRCQLGLALMLLSLLTGTARVVQSLFGFDQLFVSIPLLLHNLQAFPISYALGLALLLAAFLGSLALVLRLLPKREWRVSLSLVAITITMVAVAKTAEDNVKQNLVGTSFGYLAGQVTFSRMFDKGYTVPGGAVGDHPAAIAARGAIAARQNLWLIIVESMGLPTDPAMRSALFEPMLGAPDLTARYQIEQGRLASVGSTIHGEIRALCGGQLAHGLFDNDNQECLPYRMASAGYSTHAIHANAASMYGRDIWYRRVGFQRYSSADTEPGLIGGPSERWGTQLDGDTIAWANSAAFSPGQPHFTYLLTVSTHLPAERLPGATEIAGCLAKATEHACLHLSNLRLVISQLAQAAQVRDNTVIVLIGDHPPPFVSPGSRSAFSPTDVPWITLRPRQSLTTR